MAQLEQLAAEVPVTDGLRLVPRRRLRRLNSVSSPRGRRDDQEILVHPSAAAAAGVRDGDPVRVVSAHGSLVGPATVTDAIDPGVVAASHGYPDTHVGALTSTTHHVDPISGQIAQTGIEVVIERA